eukprot:CAMPEP_0118961958 /NCGR_PEP_ID=MMETSP1173-20130426/468_1 /TAXON_ID=1034831 /ORGANISM="Rhizochromulina marina cf, Strain CCMP1243" /LENGTH=322 /DNA_ID=CAMNT_0006910167 /DNA_START=22 /DNA_END=990 /DNA_ORIENTATION=+
MDRPSVPRFMLQGLALVALFVGATAALEEGISLFGFDIPMSPHAGFEKNPFFAFNQWINQMILPPAMLQYFEDRMTIKQAHYSVTYLRDFVAGTLLYYMVAGLWHLWIYHVRGERYFKKQGATMPSREIILDQIQLAQLSMFVYAGLPVFSEWLIEEGYTLAYWSIDEIGGWPIYVAYTAAYLACVEIGIYWMHRTLHTNKFLYKYVHGLHHKYNKPELLSPWASVAFNPLDGILQACPYVICLFIVPCHYLTHVLMLFFTAVWATNIHDALDGNTEPIMGSKYHTKHHTHYHVNFGQFFIFCDWFWGTLSAPGDSRRMKLA